MTNENAINILRHLSPPRTSKAAFDAFRQAIDMAIEALSQPEPHWIPCSERLPKKDGEYLTTWIDAQKKLCVNVFLVENGVWYWNQKYIFPNWRIIAWMPLPEPWKGE